MTKRKQSLRRLVGFVAILLFIVAMGGLVVNDDTGNSRQPMRAGSRGEDASSGSVSTPAGKERGSAGPIVILPDHFDLSPPMRDVVAPPQPAELRLEVEVALPSIRFARGDASIDDFALVLQDWSGGLNSLNEPILNVDVLPNVSGYYPPDVEGDVGPNHYVEYINVDWAVYDKSGNIAAGWPKAGNSFWSGFGGLCETENDGDPIVIYDHLADRWLVSQFAVPNPFYQCVAVSQTADPTGAWYRYAYQWPNNKFNDYPHFGLWPDGYYVTVNQFNSSGTSWQGAGVAAFERDKMLLGQSAQMIYFDLYGVNANYGGQLPADLEGPAPPPGTPNYILEWEEAGVFGSSDAVGIWEFHVDWDTPSNSTLGTGQPGGPNLVINTANVDTDICVATRERCIHQMSSCTSVRLEAIPDRLMWRVQYRNYGTHETMVANHTVDVGSGRAGIHWFELRDQGSGWGLYQQGVYGPGDGLHRWMGSIAMDPSGNIALGYSVSSSSSYPSIRYVGRLESDPLGTMPQAEQTIVNGTGCQTGSSARWGDYSSLSMDTGADECTFWYIQEYIKTTGAVSWQTRLASFEFDECGVPDFTLDATPDSLDVCVPNDAVYNVSIGQINGFGNPVTLSSSGRPAGTTESFVPNPVTPVGNSTFTIGNTGAAAPGMYDIDVMGTASDSPGHQDTVVLNLYNAVPGMPTPSSPVDGSTGVSTTPVFDWGDVANAATYEIEIATDPGFNTIVDQATGLTESTYTAGTALNADTVYYWRVRATNACGTGLDSAIWAFRTAAVANSANCRNPNAYIPGGGSVSDNMTVADTGTISDLNVSVQATQSWVGDLTFTILNVDTGTSVTIIDRPGVPASTWGCSGDNIDATLDDEASLPVENECASGTPTINGTLTPNNPLSAFDGEELSGNWRITASDAYAPADNGYLDQWCLLATASSSPVVADYSDLASSYGIAWHTGDGSFRLGNTWTADDSFGPAGRDDASDDGVTFVGAFQAGQQTTARVNVQGTASSGRWLRVWFDWNGDGVFGDAADGERVFNGTVSDGDNDIPVDVPAGLADAVNYRFRLYDSASEPTGVLAQDTGSFGGATGGEVEDGTSPAPTAVDLIRFEAAADGRAIQVEWETASEIDNLGFNLYRSEAPGGERFQLNDDLIPSQAPGSPIGAVYTWLDEAVEPGTIYYYWLEDVDIYGATTLHGPVWATARGTAEYVLFFPRIVRQAR